MSELGQSLSFVGGPSVEMSRSLHGNGANNEISESGGISVSSAFIKLFEEYPQSRNFFTEFKGTPIEEIKANVQLSKTLQDHSIRVFQLVEKVIGRMEPSIEKVCCVILFLVSKIVNRNDY